jgi:hypothetical protein
MSNRGVLPNFAVLKKTIKWQNTENGLVVG